MGQAASWCCASRLSLGSGSPVAAAGAPVAPVGAGSRCPDTRRVDEGLRHCGGPGPLPQNLLDGPVPRLAHQVQFDDVHYGPWVQ
eukprot:CAMPEP_0174323172 /NCGR_PEP_ID=MMETSP0810-20121108/11594_1 /TAXON_ID=73025 ORGANISM="Eutreptiella gymnastica-like, Strain CCMP1594" /NCGR_SAMPLE_ID=MMETSP0810 /ASSEMBLY_ACC=CAM_ASM_000659 /LENGTH=84 /DNA_ID=CAMNT_0015435439 /DNA_START=810 /DNA_END=1064 /DNA_ORIENTATION=-